MKDEQSTEYAPYGPQADIIRMAARDREALTRAAARVRALEGALRDCVAGLERAKAVLDGK